MYGRLMLAKLGYIDGKCDHNMTYIRTLWVMVQPHDSAYCQIPLDPTMILLSSIKEYQRLVKLMTKSQDFNRCHEISHGKIPRKKKSQNLEFSLPHGFSHGKNMPCLYSKKCRWTHTPLSIGHIYHPSPGFSDVQLKTTTKTTTGNWWRNRNGDWMGFEAVEVSEYISTITIVSESWTYILFNHGCLST